MELPEEEERKEIIRQALAEMQETDTEEEEKRNGVKLTSEEIEELFGEAEFLEMWEPEKIIKSLQEQYIKICKKRKHMWQFRGLKKDERDKYQKYQDEMNGEEHNYESVFVNRWLVSKEHEKK